MPGGFHGIRGAWKPCGENVTKGRSRGGGEFRFSARQKGDTTRRTSGRAKERNVLGERETARSRRDEGPPKRGRERERARQKNPKEKPATAESTAPGKNVAARSWNTEHDSFGRKSRARLSSTCPPPRPPLWPGNNDKIPRRQRRPSSRAAEGQGERGTQRGGRFRRLFVIRSRSRVVLSRSYI